MWMIELVISTPGCLLAHPLLLFWTKWGTQKKHICCAQCHMLKLLWTAEATSSNLLWWVPQKTPVAFQRWTLLCIFHSLSFTVLNGPTGNNLHAVRRWESPKPSCVSRYSDDSIPKASLIQQRCNYSRSCCQQSTTEHNLSISWQIVDKPCVSFFVQLFCFPVYIDIYFLTSSGTSIPPSGQWRFGSQFLN